VSADAAGDAGTGAFHDRLRAFEGKTAGPAEVAPDEVNQAMIRHMCEALGDENPVYVDPEAAARSVHGEVVAPPTMLQVWTMRGLRPRPPDDGGNARDDLYAMLDDAGFTGVVATDCRQTYHREVHLGDRLRVVTTVESVSPEKHTALGIGHFVTTRMSYLDAADEPVGDMLFRVLKFRPGTGRVAPSGTGSA